MEFSCSVCQYTSCNKLDVRRHINRKKSCGVGVKEIIEIPIEIKCQFCNKIFSTRSNLNSHIKKTCKFKQKALEERIKELERENNELKETIKELKQRSTTSVTKKPIEDSSKESETEIKDLESSVEVENKYIYLIQIYPYSDQIFKIGRTGNLQKRLAHYKRYRVVYATSCKDDIKCEKDLIRVLKANTEQCKELGNEYFKGTYAQMKKIIKDYFIIIE